MRCWARTECGRRWLVTVAVWLALAAVGAARADDGTAVTAVDERFTNGMYIVDASVRFVLTDDMRDALNSGIALIYDVEVEIRSTGDWLWDDVVARSVQRISLEYHSLSGTYVVSNTTSKLRRSFRDLDEALQALGDLSNLAISEERHLPKPGPYRGRMRIGLDLQTLPAPLRPIAYLSPSWPLHSDWFEWTVKQ
jgi:hypothetical protein